MKRRTRAKTEPDDRLVLTGVPCPMNSARALLHLQGMSEGEVLELWVDEGEPRENVPPSLELEGHVILDLSSVEGRCRILVRVGA